MNASHAAADDDVSGARINVSPLVEDSLPISVTTTTSSSVSSQSAPSQPVLTSLSLANQQAGT